MKKVLIISYYWPPSGGAGVQRWIRFVNHLRSFGWEPVLYVPKDANYPVVDEKLMDKIPGDIETLKLEIKEPSRFLSKLAFWKKSKKKTNYNNQQQQGKNRSLKHKITWYIRGNFFIPDARFLWIKPSVKYLSNRLKKGDIDLIVSTGPPHSLQIIARDLKRKHNIPWVADFRDPWTTMDYLQEMYLSNRAKKKHANMEASVINEADEVVVVGKTMFNEFNDNYNRQVEIIHNGYDSVGTTENQFELDQKFTIVHIGSFLKNRNCDDLWEVLSKLTKEKEDFAANFELKLVGNIAPNVMESIHRFGLDKFLNKIDYLPFIETQKHLYGAQILLLPIDRISNAEFVLTGKLFEYLKSQRPILLLGPSKGDAAHIVKNCNAGDICDFDDKNKIESVLLERYQKFLGGINQVDSVNVDQYSAKELTRKLATVFDKIIGKK